MVCSSFATSGLFSSIGDRSHRMIGSDPFCVTFLQNFGSRIEGLKKTTIDEVIMAISLTKSVKEPLIINADDGKGGERVQVFIG